MLLVAGAELGENVSLGMSWEVIHGKQATLLSGKRHFKVELVDALAVKVALGQENEALRSHQAHHQPIDEADAVIHEEKYQARHEDHLLRLLGALGLFGPIAPLHYRKLVLVEVVKYFLELLQAVHVLSHSCVIVLKR